jgi:hypothetical protein
LVIGEGGSPEGGFHLGTARSKGNNGEGQRPVVEVGDSQLGKVVGTWEVVGVASMEHVGGWRRLESGQRLQSMRQRQRSGGGEKA